MQFKALCARPAYWRRRNITKTMLVMQLTSFLLLAACLQVSASVHSQTVNFSGQNVPLEKVFASVEQQTGYVFFFDATILRASRPVTIQADNMPLELFLNTVLKEQPLQFFLQNKTIVISRKQPDRTVQQKEAYPPIDIHGHVTDTAGNPLIGASVAIKGTKMIATTNDKGDFTMVGANNNNAYLLISYIGYDTKEIELRGTQNYINIVLRHNENPLDEVQIIAYGETTQRRSTGNISSVSAKEIEEQPVGNPLLALEGRVPGLFITQTNGISGSGVTVRVQGQNSIANGNDPLYVVDGVPYTSQLLSNLGSMLGTSGAPGYSTSYGNPLSYINPSDIESIEVLKDADATSIYGSRAANGAILITTKKGKAGQTKVDLNIQKGVGQVTKTMPLLNTQQYLAMRNEAMANDGIVPSASPSAQGYSPDLKIWDTTRYTNWQKVLIGNTSQYTNAQGSVSGGNVNTQFLFGGGYHKETTVFPGDFSDQKGSVHFSINNVSNNKKFRAQLTGSYLIDNNQLPNQDLTAAALATAPDAPPLYNPDGSLNWAPNSTGSSTWVNGNPIATYTYRKYSNKTNNLIGNAVLSYQILPGLDIKSSLGYTNLQVNEISTSPLSAVAPANRAYSQNTAFYGNNNINSWIVEPQITYKRSLGKGRLEALVGTTIEQQNSNGQELVGQGYSSELNLDDIKSASKVTVNSTVADIYKYNALFGRLNYNWEDKYLVDLTARRDGSSRFGPSNEFHDFAAAGAGWVFSKEAFMQGAASLLDFGKVRASYGTTGNDQIGDYQYLAQYAPAAGQPYQGVQGIAPTGLPNPYLQWELTRKLNFGLDLGFLKDRILFTANYSVNRSSNELLSYALPIITGFGSIETNFPATLQNTSLELALTATIIKSRSFTWTTHINLTVPKNTLVSFPNLASSSYASSLVVGQPITVRKVFHLMGVNSTTGEYQFADSKGNPTYNPQSGKDNNTLINLTPRFYGGFQNSFSYKGLQLDVLFSFVKQKGISDQFGNYPGSFSFGNQPTSVLNRWQKAGDVATVQRYNTNYQLIGQWIDAAYDSDAGFTDASYIRLKNVSLSWQIPKLWQEKMYLQNFRLYIQGQNLLTITHYKGMDPENPQGFGSGLPPLKVLTMGIQATF
jgi:TonB-dependent starch-binding outer membrane protein SusC